jgi:RimJ/RimL family protein N-acetyltransferase
VKHELRVEGVGYRLRPIRVADAKFVIDIRLEDQDRNQYIHTISSALAPQEEWLERYLEREGDFYFVVENKVTGEREGLVGIYDIQDGKAEWGRWVIKKGSLATTESLDLLFKVAFHTLDLEELYCRTINDNDRVVSLHDSLPQLRRGILKDFLDLNDIKYDVVEHYTTPKHYHEKIAPALEKKAMLIFQRNLRSLIGLLEFHHIGLATDNIEDEFSAYRFLGYAREDALFEDHEQGIKGQFITAQGQPRIELLENLKGSTTLDVWLKNRVKMYHFAYKTANIEKAINILNRNRIRTVTPLKMSVYFKKRICFLLLSPGFLIELIEE